ncbi:50S ribosome-binding GTPase [Empedobacter falsenii]
MTNKECQYLICVYLLVIDAEIHSQEIDYLTSNFPELGEYTKNQAEKIMSDADNKIELSKLIDNLKSESEKEIINLFKILIQLAINDGFFHNKEKEFVRNLAIELNIQVNNIEELITKYENEYQVNYIEKKQSLYKSLKEKIFQKLHNITDSELFEDSLLEGNSFVEKVKEIAARASNDLDLASEKMIKFNKILEGNFKNIEKYSKQILDLDSEHKKESLSSFIEKLNNDTKKDILTSIKKNTEVLEKKKYTVDYFSIAFLGRTKAGKSTFHKVITGEETDDVGVGKLRTTRYNRVFNWENIRVIDTPGIGAPGGKDDTEVARSIIDEADLVCYVVTNDAIQETEFNFLTELKDKNKPIFIILNYKENIEHPKRLERFLKNPKAWLENKDDKSLDGHIQRINEMISKFNYDPTLIEVVPIHLLAAKLAKKEQDSKVNKTLIDGSNINHYNKLIKQTIFRNGHLKKTQNIIDGCNYQTSFTYHKTKHDIEELNKLLNSIKGEKQGLIKYFDLEQKKTNQSISTFIINTHNQIKTDLKGFASDEYENKDIGKAWEKFMTDKGYYETLNLKIEDVISDFQKKITDKLKESLQDISINMAKLDIQHINLDTVDYKFATNIAVGLVGSTVGILALLNIWHPGGWVLGGIAVVGLLANFIFDSKDKKIKKAIDKIVESIEPKINENEKEILKNYEVGFIDSTQQIKVKLSSTFDEMIDGIENILNVLNIINQHAKEYSDYFNKVLFFRSLEHMGKIKLNNLLTEEIVQKGLYNTTITRHQENLFVNTTYKLKNEELKQLNKALQLNITLN